MRPSPSCVPACEALFTAVATATGLPTDAAHELAAATVARAGRRSRLRRTRRPITTTGSSWLPGCSWSRSADSPAPPTRPRRSGPGTRSSDWLLRSRSGLRHLGLDEGAAWLATDRVRILFALTRPSAIGGSARGRDAKLIAAWLASPTIRTALGVNAWEGVEYVSRDRLVDLLGWAARLDAIAADAAEAEVDASFVERITAAADAAGYRVDHLVAPPPPPRPAKATAKAKASPTKVSPADPAAETPATSRRRKPPKARP